MQLTEYEAKALNKLWVTVHENKWTNNGLVELIKLAGLFLNVMSAPEYSKKRGISDVAARKDAQYRKNEDIFNTNYVIDNY